MRLTFAAGGVAALLLATAPASAATWVTVELEIEVAATADETWAAVGADYCAIEVWLGMGCVLTAGEGGLSSVRVLNERIEEVIVGQGLRSTTYLQTVGSMAVANYHGTLSVEPVTETTSRIVYTLIWDEDALEPDRREPSRTNFTAAFQGALETMKTLVEGG